MKVIVSAPAKINLTLDILDKRSDGFHNVKMIMQSVDLCDVITISENLSGKVTVESTNSKVPTDESNAVCKATAAFYAKIEEKCKGLHIFIEKHIPVSAGLAGGSTDGAAVLVGLNKIYGSPFTDYELEQLGASIGSDVPFCVRGGTALAQGTGTVLTQLGGIPQCSILLIKPPVDISTALAYKQADERGFVQNSSTDKILLHLNDIGAIGKCLHNDFEDVINVECIDLIKKTMFEGGALGACMSGSGPSVYGIFDSFLKSKECSFKLKNGFGKTFLVKPIDHGCTVINLV